MNEFDIINKYFRKIIKNNPAALDLNDDVLYRLATLVFTRQVLFIIK